MRVEIFKDKRKPQAGMHMSLAMINFNYKILSPVNHEFLMRISSEKQKGHKQYCVHPVTSVGAFKPTQYLGNVWLFPELITAKKGRGKPGSMLSLLHACEIS